MTPKEKANDLFHTITLIVLDTSFGVNKTSVKKLALHAIDEIISTIVSTPNNCGASWIYWTEVKKEIEKL
jgi:hypothetical protein